jgi:hypothetical protein
MKMRTAILLLALLVAAFSLGFPRSLSREYILQPRWVTQITGEAQVRDLSPAQPYAFRLGDTFGYVSRGGDIGLETRVLYDVGYSDTVFANYSSVARNLVFADPTGGFLKSIEAIGYPHIVGDRTFVFGSNGSSIAEYDALGELRWRRQCPALITSMACADDFVLLGLVDGRASLVSDTGDEVFAYVPGGSRLSVVLAVAIAEDAGRIALVSGVDPHRFVALSATGGSYEVVTSLDLSGDFRRQWYARFSEDGALAFFGGMDRLWIYCAASADVTSIAVQGRVRGVERVPDGLAAVWSETRDAGHLVVFDPTGVVIARHVFPAETTFFRALEDDLLLGLDSHLVSLDLEVEP